MCVVTREVRPVADLIRFVVGPDGEAVPDLKSKLPGRGVWVTATHDALAEAVKRKTLARGFKREVRLAADLVEQTEQLLESAVLDALAMAGKSGLVATGFGKTEAALAHDGSSASFTRPKPRRTASESLAPPSAGFRRTAKSL